MANLDLNLLRVLKVLLEVPNTHKAAEKLNLSQSSVSKSLNKLRDYFNDPLFIRDKFGLKPTSKAIELGKQLPAALDHLNRVIDNNQAFLPKNISSTITLAVNSFIFEWIGSDLYFELLSQAPNMELHMIHWNEDSEGEMLKGEIDVGINYLSPYIGKQIHQQKVFDDDFICVVRKDHPIANRLLEATDFDLYALASLIIPSWNLQQAKMQEAVRKMNKNLNIQLRSTSLPTILDVVSKTDLIFPCPHRVALTFDPSQFQIVNIVENMPRPDGTVVLLIDKVRKADRQMQWLTQQIRKIINKRTK